MRACNKHSRIITKPIINMLIYYIYFIYELKFYHKEGFKTLMTTVIARAHMV